MPSMWDWRRDTPNYLPLPQGVELQPSEDDVASTASSPASMNSNAIRPGVNGRHHAGDGTLSPRKLSKKDGRMQTAISTSLSVFMVIFVCSLSLGLGGYSVFIFKPAPVIDKSVDAFSIPNHNASKGYHALQQAKSRRIFGRRSGKVKRDTAKTHGARHPNSFVDEDFAGNIQDRLDLGAVLPRKEMFRDAFTMAREPHSHRVVRRRAERLQQSRHPRTYYSVRQGRVQWRLEVIFKAVDEKGESANIFTKERLETVHSIEQQIINHPNYTKFCWVDIDSQSSKNKAYSGCTPLNSLMTYFYPSVLPNGQLLYDGRGSNMADINSSLGLAMSHKQFYYFVDENVNSQNPKSRLLRTEVLFGAPLEGFASALTDKKQQADLYEKFVVTYIDMLSSASTSKVQVMYGGNEIFDYEVDAAFWRDLWLARFALLFIGLFVLVLTSFSLWLSFWGLVAIGLSFPLALFLYRFVFSIQALGILNGVAAFVVIGIGVDDVFVFVNTFRQAEHMDKIKGRLLYTVKTAGTATFFTSFTTAAAFAANIASTIPALHEFGLFMALIVVCCWVSVVLLMPPVLYLWYLVFAYIEGSLFKAAKRLFYRIVLRQDINTLQVYYRSGSDQIVTDASVSPQADDDVPMLTLENEETVESDDDEPLLVPYLGESQAPFQSPSSKQTKGRQLLDLGHFLQLALCRYITQPVIKYRWVVAVVYAVILATSVGLVTQIKLSSKPPQLFRDSSNLQRMLDLKANLSIDKFFCPRCSGAYSDTAASLPNNPEIPNIPSHIPAKWENMTYPPEGFPKPTLPWKPTKSPPSKKPYSKHHKSTTRASSQSKSISTAAPTQRPPTRRDNKSPMTTSPPAIHHKHDVTTNRKSSPTTSPHPPVVTSPVGVSSLPKGFKVCQGKDCGKAEKRPVMESHAIVYVVFGIQSLDRSNLTSNHVINNNYGTVIYDDKFAQHFRRNASHSVSPADIKELCRVCKRIAANSELVINGSAQCLPRMMEQLIGTYLQNFPECHGLPRNLRLYNQQAPGHAEARPTDDLMGIRWMAFAFESTTSKGQSYFQAYDEYLKWEKFIGTVRSEIRADSPLRSIYQASDFWTKVLMEVVCVSSAIYGVVLSIFVCIIAVAIFTGHFLLLLIVLLTIGGIISLVVAVFFLCGWEMGAVEAVSLSILVGSSVDYCVHVVEGYLLAGRSPHLNAIQSASDQRQWRVMQAVQHIGVSIVSSALTTIAAAIPLTQATIRPFSRFGDIVAMNTAFAIVYTLTACSAFLAIFAPARFKSSWRSSGIALAITLACTGVFVLVLYILSRVGVTIPSPNGDALFPN